jgi:hypothetical protein
VTSWGKRALPQGPSRPSTTPWEGRLVVEVSLVGGAAAADADQVLGCVEERQVVVARRGRVTVVEGLHQAASGELGHEPLQTQVRPEPLLLVVAVRTEPGVRVEGELATGHLGAPPVGRWTTAAGAAVTNRSLGTCTS